MEASFYSFFSCLAICTQTSQTSQTRSLHPSPNCPPISPKLSTLTTRKRGRTKLQSPCLNRTQKFSRNSNKWLAFPGRPPGPASPSLSAPQRIFHSFFVPHLRFASTFVLPPKKRPFDFMACFYMAFFFWANFPANPKNQVNIYRNPKLHALT